MVNITKGAVGGTVGLGVGAVKYVASTSYGVVSKVLSISLYNVLSFEHLTMDTLSAILTHACVLEN